MTAVGEHTGLLEIARQQTRRCREQPEEEESDGVRTQTTEFSEGGKLQQVYWVKGCKK